MSKYKIYPFQVGDIVKMKKSHPCGSDRWEILRTGADFRIKCLGCARSLMLPRPKFEKSVKEILSGTDSKESDK
jgi:hypothetical protein